MGSERLGPAKPLRIAPGGDDAFGSEQARALHGDRPRGPGRPEDEHAVVSLDRRAPGDRQPAGDSRDPGRDGNGVVDTLRNRAEIGLVDGDLLREGSVAGKPEPASEDVDARAPGPP